MNLKGCISISDIESKALSTLPKSTKDYYQSGAQDEITSARNIQAFKNLLIRPFVLRDVSQLDTSVEIALANRVTGTKQSYRLKYPLGIAPTSFHSMAHKDGELATFKAASDTETLAINSTISSVRLEEISEHTPESHKWFQLHIYKDRKVSESLVNRAEAAGFKAIVLTVDVPIIGRIQANERNGFDAPSKIVRANLVDYPEKPSYDASQNWNDLKWLVSISKLPVIIKGIMRPDDALRAIEAGVAGIIVSNHGGRQLDGAASTIEALPEIAKVVQKKCPVFLDGGIRTGVDIFKAIALGADTVFIGRPVIYGLLLDGKEGVMHVIDLLRKEFEYAMQLSGCSSIKEIQSAKDIVVHKNYYNTL